MRAILRCLLLLVLAAPASLLAEHQLLANGDFDAGIEPWTLSDETDGAIYELSWNGAAGSPLGGSLQLAQRPDTVTSFSGETVSECFDVSPGGTLELTTRVFAEGEVYCSPFIIQYRGPGCTGSRIFRGRDGSGLPPRTPPGQWITTSTVAAFPFESYPSLRAGLTIDGGSGPTACRFDSVVLGDPADLSVTEVPTSSEIGLWLFAVLLGVTGAGWVLRAGG